MCKSWKLYRFVPLIFAAGALACGGTTSPTSPTNAVTDTFNGTVNQGGISDNTFTMGQNGTATITAVSFSPVSGITMGVGVGTPQSDGSCSLSAASNSVTEGMVLSDDLNAGTYCLAVYDVGYVAPAVPITYQVTVGHP